MKIEFDTTFTDILRFSASHQFRSIPIQVLILLLPVFIFFSEVLYKINGQSHSTAIEAFFTAMAWYVGLWAFQLAFNVIYLYSKKNKSVLTTHIVELQDDAFYEETAYNRSYFYWNGITKVIKITGFIAVYVTPHMAIIIPNRAFSTTEDRENFFVQLKTKMEKS